MRDKAIIRFWPIEARLFTTSKIASHIFGAVVALMILGSWYTHMRVAEAKAEAARVERLAQLQLDEREITCLANIVYHESRGEAIGVRELVAKTTLAITADRTMKLPKTVCKLAKVPGFFSQLKDAETPRFALATWAKIHAEMSDVYYGPRTLPRGWGCVRGFRVSDDQLEKLGPKAIAQLGFTVEAKGLKYFAAHRVPVDTRGSITFYAPRGGCRNPAETI